MTRQNTAKRDQRIADEAAVDRTLLCCANGCPNVWSVDAGNGHCCTAHAYASRHYWPQITQEQLDAEADRALVAAAPKHVEPAAVLSEREKRQLLMRLASVLQKPKDPRAWIGRLEARARAGQQLSTVQRDALRQVHSPLIGPEERAIDNDIEEAA